MGDWRSLGGNRTAKTKILMLFLRGCGRVGDEEGRLRDQSLGAIKMLLASYEEKSVICNCKMRRRCRRRGLNWLERLSQLRRSGDGFYNSSTSLVQGALIQSTKTMDTGIKHATTKRHPKNDV